MAFWLPIEFGVGEGLELWLCDYFVYYHKSSVKPPGGLIYFEPSWGGELNRDGGFILRGGGIFNLETMMVSVLHKELEYKVEKLTYKKFQVIQPRIRIKFKFPVGK